MRQTQKVRQFVKFSKFVKFREMTQKFVRYDSSDLKNTITRAYAGNTA